MATDFTMTYMVESLKKRGLIPVADKTFNNEALIRFMSEELQNFIAPELMTVRENYFVEKYDQNLVGGESRYNIHPRATGVKLKSMFYFDQNDKPQQKIYQVNIDDILGYGDWDNLGQSPQYFYFIDNYVELIPKPKNGVLGSIRQYYFLRRNRLVDVSEAGRITQITAGASTTDIVINATPSGFSDQVQYDFVKGTPGFQCLKIDKTPDGVSGTTFTFNNDDVPSNLAVGDWLCLAGESPIPQIPLDAFPLLAQQGVYVTLLALNDAMGAEKAKAKRDELLKQTIRLISARSEDDAKTIVSAQNIGNFIMNGTPGLLGWPAG